MQRRYITVDVFTDRAFGGNPLAVVLDAGGLATAQMQSIASEFNYSETTFVLPPQDPAHDAQVRIFTVNREIPFAGHPNVGTAFVLATQASKPPARLLFEENAGLVPVEILAEEGSVVGAELTAPQALKKLTPFSAEQAAACISLAAADIRTDRHTPQIVSVGLPFLVVELTSRDALRRASSTTRNGSPTETICGVCRSVLISAAASEIQAAACSALNGVSFFRACGAVSSAPTTPPSSVRISTGTRPAFSSNFSRAGAFGACVASTKAVPTLGWPAKGISRFTVKIRTCALYVGSCGGNTKVVSE